jgi:hypothetical protein
MHTHAHARALRPPAPDARACPRTNARDPQPQKSAPPYIKIYKVGPYFAPADTPQPKNTKLKLKRAVSRPLQVFLFFLCVPSFLYPPL